MNRLRDRQISARTLGLIALGAVVVLALVGWFGLVSPQRSKASDLNGQLAAANEQLHVANVLASVQKSGNGKKSGAVLLQNAMPGLLLMPDVLEQVESLATSAKVNLNSFVPSTATAANYYDVVPIAVTVDGRYANVKAFLRQLRLQAGSKRNHIYAKGRLFDIENVNLGAGDGGAPELNASIQLAVFVYTGRALAPATTTTTTSNEGGI
jgi:hypothetical protein